jgi:hypothetical protein
MGATKAARISVDFVIDGQSLLAELIAANDGESYPSESLAEGFMGCFVDGFDSDNTRKSLQLAAALEPDTEEGRYLLYVCPECGDLGCGAYGAKIRLTEDDVEWYNFAYENGYEPGHSLPSVGPFFFNRSEYMAQILSFGAL